MMKTGRIMMAIHLVILTLALPSSASGDAEDSPRRGAEVDPDPGVVLVITADDLDELTRDERLVLDRRADGRVIVIDPGHGPIDLSRIEIVSLDGRRMSGGAWLATQARDTTIHGPTVLAPPDQVRPGLRVKARWRDERIGHVKDVLAFVPA